MKQEVEKSKTKNAKRIGRYIWISMICPNKHMKCYGYKIMKSDYYEYINMIQTKKNNKKEMNVCVRNTGSYTKNEIINIGHW